LLVALRSSQLTKQKDECHYPAMPKACISKNIAVLVAFALLIPRLTAAANHSTSGHRKPTTAGSDTQEKTARAACLAGDFQKGVEILSKLFVNSKDPNYIYNQGRCFEQNGRYQDAVTRFKEYLRVGKKISEEDKVETLKHIDDCSALLAAEKNQATPAPTYQTYAPQQPGPGYAAPSPMWPAPGSPGPTTYAPNQPPLSQPSLQTSAQRSSGDGSGLRLTGAITAGVGIAALVGGIVFNAKANGLVHDFQSVPNGYTPSESSDRDTYETLSWVGYGLGATCLVTGGVLYYLGVRSSHRDRISMVPTIAPGLAITSIQGSF
jgi:hypothetical protein